jgi:hypothetical protein
MVNLSAGICASWLTNLNQRHIVPVQRDLSILNQIILNVSALMEIKSAMGLLLLPQQQLHSVGYLALYLVLQMLWDAMKKKSQKR